MVTPLNKPHWYWVPVKALAITFPLTLISFALGLFLGIVGMLIRGWVLNSQVNLTLAYRDVALPIAITAAVIVFVSSLVMEVQRYRQEKALVEIQNAG
jgi:hypothetical protein